MTLEQIKINLKKLGISLKQAAKEVGYSKDHFYRVMRHQHPVTRTFLKDLTTYVENKFFNEQNIEVVTVIDNIHELNEMNMPHNNEWQKLKQTELYKKLTNGTN